MSLAFDTTFGQILIGFWVSAISGKTLENQKHMLLISGFFLENQVLWEITDFLCWFFRFFLRSDLLGIFACAFLRLFADSKNYDAVAGGFVARLHRVILSGFCRRSQISHWHAMVFLVAEFAKPEIHVKKNFKNRRAFQKQSHVKIMRSRSRARSYKFARYAFWKPCFEWP